MRAYPDKRYLLERAGLACPGAGGSATEACPGMCATAQAAQRAAAPSAPVPWPPFPTAGYRFDQKNDIFNRGGWDPNIIQLSRRFHEAVHQERAGYRKLDYALQAGAWNVEDVFGYEEVTRGGPALYSWRGEEGGLAGACARTGAPVREDPAEMSRVVKKVALLYGADLVGITRVHRDWVYSHSYSKLTGEHRSLELPLDCSYAVVMALEMDYEAMRTSPTGPAGGAVGVGYSRMAFTTNLLATFIRALGYRAVPCGNDTALSIPLAMAAGLGEPSRMGLLVTEEFGPRVRLCEVFTDLPLATDSYKPFGVLEFCRSCKTCARHCPSQAISSGDMTLFGPNLSSHHGPLKWYLDAERCYGYWAQKRMDCCVCIRVCPFNKPPGLLHRAVRTAIHRAPSLDGLIVRADRWLGYERALKAADYWQAPTAGAGRRKHGGHHV